MRGMTRSVTVPAPAPSHIGDTMLNRKLQVYATTTLPVVRKTNAIGIDSSGAAIPTHNRALIERDLSRSEIQPPNVTPINPPSAAVRPRIVPAVEASTPCTRRMNGGAQNPIP